MTIKPKEIWSIDRRPMLVAGIALPERIKSVVSDLVSTNKSLPNMILSGPPGCGKTTVALAITRERDMEVLFINASLEGGIDTLRTTIMDFASTASLGSSEKVVIFDEADHITPTAQASLRGFIEQFSSNCRFILTCNHQNKIIPALFSRCTHIHFDLTSADLAEVGKQMYEGCVELLDSQGITFNSRAVKKLIANRFPDFRKVIGVLQLHAQQHGSIGVEVLDSTKQSVDITELIGFLKTRNFKAVRSWVVANLNADVDSIYRRLYDVMYDFVVPEAIPAFVLLVHDYMRDRQNVSDEEISAITFLTNVMLEIDLK